METIVFNVYGTPSKMVLDSIMRIIPGTNVMMKTKSAGGYIRLK
jgi:hypothetical protein